MTKKPIDLVPDQGPQLSMFWRAVAEALSDKGIEEPFLYYMANGLSENYLAQVAVTPGEIEANAERLVEFAQEKVAQALAESAT